MVVLADSLISSLGGPWGPGGLLGGIWEPLGPSRPPKLSSKEDDSDLHLNKFMEIALLRTILYCWSFLNVFVNVYKFSFALIGFGHTGEENKRRKEEGKKFKT